MDLPKQNLEVNIENKQNYGEVHSPYEIIERMFDLLPEEVFKDPTKRWLDPGTGRGYFSIFLLNKLMQTLSSIIPDPEIRKNHIIKNMIWMVEINQEHQDALLQVFPDGNLVSLDYLSTTLETYQTLFDIIIGNPPFNFGGLKKVPTNTTRAKKKDGKTVWSQFIKHSVSLLKENGYLVFIVPSIWMKEDKDLMYFYMTQFKLHKIHCLTNTEMNSLFKGHAQTPSCYFLMEKKCTDNKVLLYDNDVSKYVEFPLRPEKVLPVACADLLREMLPYVDKFGSLSYISKSNLPGKDILFSQTKSKKYPYANVKTCIIKDKLQPELVFQYSNKPCPFYGKKKLILAHGMYGFPFIDATGKFGISNRDKYIIETDNIEDLVRLYNFLSSDLAFYLFNATRYRMKYLEKYIFRYLPNVINMSENEVTEMHKNLLVPKETKNKYKTIT